MSGNPFSADGDKTQIGGSPGESSRPVVDGSSPFGRPRGPSEDGG